MFFGRLTYHIKIHGSNLSYKIGFTSEFCILLINMSKRGFKLTASSLGLCNIVLQAFVKSNNQVRKQSRMEGNRQLEKCIQGLFNQAKNFDGRGCETLFVGPRIPRLTYVKEDLKMDNNITIKVRGSFG